MLAPSSELTVPDYELDDELRLENATQLKAISSDLRRTILAMLSERAATTTEIAESLERPKGTVGHHLKVLAGAGLVRVVRTRKVRALTAKYYGRTARTFVIAGDPSQPSKGFDMLRQVMDEAVVRPGEALPMFTVRHARIPLERALEFAEAVNRVAIEFAAEPRDGAVTYGLVGGVYPTDRRALKGET